MTIYFITGGILAAAWIIADWATRRSLERKDLADADATEFAVDTSQPPLPPPLARAIDGVITTGTYLRRRKYKLYLAAYKAACEAERSGKEGRPR